MSSEANKKFVSNIKKEIQQKIKTENKNIKALNDENMELTRSIEGYSNFYHEVEHFFTESMDDFNVKQDELPDYFKSNINEVYQNYSQIRLDAIDEKNHLNEYILHCKKEIQTNQRSLKFYKSQYSDSDIFSECLPLVDVYEKKIELYEKNIQKTNDIISTLDEIINILSNWK